LGRRDGCPNCGCGGILRKTRLKVGDPVMAQNSSAKDAEEVRTVVIELARTELAAVTAALKFWGGWIESATKYAQRLNSELTQVGAGGADSQQLVGRVTDFGREYVREVIALPAVAMEHFASEVEKISKRTAAQSSPKRVRRARAKA
jgi:hypothetical protein